MKPIETQASTAINRDSQADKPLILSLAKELSATKRGGTEFKPDVLTEKVRNVVKSRMGLQRTDKLPEDWHKAIVYVCDGLADTLRDQGFENGFKSVKLSGVKVAFNFRNNQVSEQLQETYERQLDIEKQLRHIKFFLSGSVGTPGTYLFKRAMLDKWIASHPGEIEASKAREERLCAWREKLELMRLRLIQELRKAGVEAPADI